MINIYSNIVDDNQAVSRWWLYIAILSIVASGAPVFYLGLATHLFFISTGMFIIASRTSVKFNFVSNISSITSLLGAALAIVFVLINYDRYIENKFFPIYNNLFFVMGLSLFFAGVVLQSVILLIDKRNFYSKSIEAIALSLIMLLAILSFFISFYNLKDTLVGTIAFDHKEFYEIIFCSFSNILNFFYIHLFILCTIYIIRVCFSKKEIFTKFEINIFSIFTIAAALSTFSSFYFHSINSSSFISFCDLHLKVFAGLILGSFLLRCLICAAYNYKGLILRDNKIIFLRKTLLVGFIFFIAEDFIIQFLKESLTISFAGFKIFLERIIIAFFCIYIIKLKHQKNYKLANVALNLYILAVSIFFLQHLIYIKPHNDFTNFFIIKWLGYLIYSSTLPLWAIMYLGFISSQIIFIILSIRFLKDNHGTKKAN